MIITLIVATIAAGVALLRGGSLSSLADTRFGWVSLLLVALGVQIGVDIWDPPWLGDAGGLAVILATNVLVVVFLAINRHLPGMGLAAAGFALNVIAIALNGAMPVSERATDIAGAASLNDLGVKHERLDDDTLLPWITDVIPIPGIGTVISVGDVVLAAGIGRLVYARTRAPAETEPQGPDGPARPDAAA